MASLTQYLYLRTWKVPRAYPIGPDPSIPEGELARIGRIGIIGNIGRICRIGRIGKIGRIDKD